MASPQWPERFAAGSEHERRVREELERRGWIVATYGLGVLPESIRRALGVTESTMRWDADLIACQGSTVVLIDAKTSLRGDNARTYSISRKALRAHVRMFAERDLPIYYVFGNLGVATPADVMQICGITNMGEAGGYLTIPAGAPRPFDEVFGGPAQVARVAA